MITTPPKLEPVGNWEQLPAGFLHRDVAGVAVDANDRVYLATRVRSCIFVYERDGTFVRTWGEGMFSPAVLTKLSYASFGRSATG